MKLIQKLTLVAGCACALALPLAALPLNELNVTQPAGKDAVDALLQREATVAILAEYDDLLRYAYVKADMEMHLGFGGNLFLGSEGQLVNHNYNLVTDYNGAAHRLTLNGNILVKFNLNNPKLPFAPTILQKINYIREATQQYKVPLSPEAQAKIDQIQKDLEAYQAEFFFKRWSMGLGLPFTLQDGLGSGASSANVKFEDTFLFVGTDFGDLFTVELGSNCFFNRFFVGLSVDISTPVMQYSNGFTNALINFFKAGALAAPTQLNPLN